MEKEELAESEALRDPVLLTVLSADALVSTDGNVVVLGVALSAADDDTDGDSDWERELHGVADGEPVAERDAPTDTDAESEAESAAVLDVDADAEADGDGGRLSRAEAETVPA